MKNLKKFLNVHLVFLLLLSSFQMNVALAHVESDRYIFSSSPEDSHRFLLIDYGQDHFYFKTSMCEVGKDEVAKDVIKNGGIAKARCESVRKYKVALIDYALSLWFHESHNKSGIQILSGISSVVIGTLGFFFSFDREMVRKFLPGKYLLLGLLSVIVGTFSSGYFLLGDFVHSYLEENYFNLETHEKKDLLNLHPDRHNYNYDSLRTIERPLEEFLQMIEKAHSDYFHE